MIRAIHNNTATINTQVFVVTIYVNTNKSNPQTLINTGYYKKTSH